MALACKELCTGCTACASVCPQGMISMESNAEGFLYPIRNTECCTECGLCESVCPIATKPLVLGEQTHAYAAISCYEDERVASTSGGVFSLLCGWVLERSGVVFGAAFDESWQVEHRWIETKEEVAALRTAKYSQSKMGDAFSCVKRFLSEGRYVLFSGTPCQVVGLQTFLGKKYEKLILVDLICHGVPAPSVWQRYITYRRDTDSSGEEITGINFRSKETGWTGYSVRFDYANGQKYTAVNRDDPYMRAFVGNLDLRSSCYQCKFKGFYRSSDFTLGDYWGVWNQEPDYHDDKGTSIVMVHSPKGENIWEALSAHIKRKSVDENISLSENPSALVSSPRPEQRNVFMERYLADDFTELVEELLPKPRQDSGNSVLSRVSRKIRRTLKNLY